MSQTTRRIVTLFLAALPALAAVLVPLRCPAQDVVWKTGPLLRRQLESPVSITWASRPLRDGLHNLSTHPDIRVAMFLDRRIDPELRVDLSVKDLPLEQALRQLAKSARMGVCMIGPVAYFGPEPATGRLATRTAALDEAISKLDPAVRRNLGAVRKWQWDELATPRDLVKQLAEEASVEVEEIDSIQHDLWPAADLPPLSWTDRLSLVLAGFDLSFEVTDGGAQVALIPMPEAETVRRSYRLVGEMVKNADRIGALLPDVQQDRRGNLLVVDATLEQHELIGRVLRGEPLEGAASTPLDKQTYTISAMNQSVGALVRKLAERMEVEVKFDRRASAALRVIVSVDLKDASFDELMRAVLDPAGLTYRLEGRTLEILPATP
jgi:hypothetical protein